MKTFELLTKLISFDSQCIKSNIQIVTYLEKIFLSQKKKLPFMEIKKTLVKKGSLELKNLAIIYRGKNNQTPLIFSGHTDTVPISANWKKNPFRAQKNGDRVYGLGATDMKAGLTAIISAGLAITKQPQNDIYLLFDADEEDTGVGGKDFLKKIKLNKKAGVIIAEPTNNTLFIGQKGVLDIKITCFGKAGHSSLINSKTNRQNNAIQKATRIIDELQKIEIKLDQLKQSPFTSPSQAICQITGGTAPNVIPDQCSFIISRRYLPRENPNKILAQIKSIARKIDPLTKVEVKFFGPANLLSTKSSFFKNCTSIAQNNLGQNKISTMSGWTQAGLFKQWGDCLIWGPGVLSMAHQADEYCLLSQIDQMAQCYTELIKKY